jgi:hypothetical protein
LEEVQPGAGADVGAQPEADVVGEVARHREDPAREERVRGRAVGDARVGRREPAELAVGHVDVVGEHRPAAHEPVALVGFQVVARPREQLGHRLDLGRVLVEVAGEEDVVGGVREQRAADLEHRVGAGQREPRRDGVAQPAAAVPALEQGPALRVRGVRRGVQLGRRLRSDSTSPLVIRRPDRSALVNSSSCAPAKCEPKTSAVVVPLRARPRTNARATSRA